MYFMKPIPETDQELISAAKTLVDTFANAVLSHVHSQDGLRQAYCDNLTTADNKILAGICDQQHQLPNVLDLDTDAEKHEVEAHHAVLSSLIQDQFLAVARRFMSMERLAAFVPDNVMEHAGVYHAVLEKYELRNAAAVLNYKVGVKLG